MPLRTSFHNLVIVITGGTSGIGKHLAQALAERQATVIVCGNAEVQLNRTRTEFANAKLGIDVRQCDIRSDAEVSRLAADVLRDHGRIDILVNNAGYAVYRPFEESSTDEVIDIVNVNLLGAMRLTKAILPQMIRQRSGNVVNVASIGGRLIITPNASYCAAKHGLVAWSSALRYELALFGISVHVICPDHVKTGFQDHPTFRRRDPYRNPQRASAISVDDVVNAIIAALTHGRHMSYAPRRGGLFVWLAGLAPPLFDIVWRRIMAKRMRQVYEQIDEERHSSGERLEEIDKSPA